ncbi:MAG TPA: hypothetical protein VFW09_12880 [Solirubrobacteraceae bacterium]|nr:hypothetical protein [Solirubrobacteraceae bacterium]
MSPATRTQFLDLSFWKARDYLADTNGPPHSYVERSAYVAGPMPSAGIATMLAHTRRWPGTGAAAGRLDFWLWGGAINKPGPRSTAFVH